MRVGRSNREEKKPYLCSFEELGGSDARLVRIKEMIYLLARGLGEMEDGEG